MIFSPFISIIVPMYNRESFIERALHSCISQNYEDFELIVVDDGSTDRSISKAQNIIDSRIRIICQEFNRGVGPARNVGAAEARGEWVVCLDSDDELIPGALQTIFCRAKEAKEDVHGFRFSCRMDNGRTSPCPPLVESLWNYEQYLCWIESVQGELQETMIVVRRKTFEKIQYSNNRALENVYHLDFAQRYLIQSCPEAVRLYHSDAKNQLTKPDTYQVLRSAPDQLKSLEYLISKHGVNIELYAPSVFKDYLTGIITLYFLSGERLSGFRAVYRYRNKYKLNTRIYGIMILGVINRKLLAFAKTCRNNNA